MKPAVLPPADIAPTLIETGMLVGNPNIKKELSPVGRFGTPEEVADAAIAGKQRLHHRADN